MDAGTRVVSCAPEVGQTWIALRLPYPGRELDSVRLSGDSALTRKRAAAGARRRGADRRARPPGPRPDRVPVRRGAERGRGWRYSLADRPEQRADCADGLRPALGVELPGYAAPARTTAEGVPGRYEDLELPAASGELGEPLPLAVWCTADSADGEPPRDGSLRRRTASSPSWTGRRRSGGRNCDARSGGRRNRRRSACGPSS